MQPVVIGYFARSTKHALVAASGWSPPVAAALADEQVTPIFPRREMVSEIGSPSVEGYRGGLCSREWGAVIGRRGHAVSRLGQR